MSSPTTGILSRKGSELCSGVDLTEIRDTGGQKPNLPKDDHRVKTLAGADSNALRPGRGQPSLEVWKLFCFCGLWCKLRTR